MANPKAILDTSLGPITVELFLDQMPLTAGNFVELAKGGFYDGLHFHRVIEATEKLLDGPAPLEPVWLNEKD